MLKLKWDILGKTSEILEAMTLGFHTLWKRVPGRETDGLVGIRRSTGTRSAQAKIIIEFPGEGHKSRDGCVLWANVSIATLKDMLHALVRMRNQFSWALLSAQRNFWKTLFENGTFYVLWLGRKVRTLLISMKKAQSWTGELPCGDIDCDLHPFTSNLIVQRLAIATPTLIPGSFWRGLKFYKI